MQSGKSFCKPTLRGIRSLRRHRSLRRRRRHKPLRRRRRAPRQTPLKQAGPRHRPRPLLHPLKRRPARLHTAATARPSHPRQTNRLRASRPPPQRRGLWRSGKGPPKLCSRLQPARFENPLGKYLRPPNLRPNRPNQPPCRRTRLPRRVTGFGTCVPRRAANSVPRPATSCAPG